MANTQKRDRRDRRDRIYVRNQDSMHVIMPYIMPNRCDNEAVLNELIDITALNDYLAKKNAQNPDFKYTWFHVISAALAKVIVLRPKMNYFYSGNRLYERRDIEIAFNVKKKFEDNGDEAVAKCAIDRNGGSPVEQVHDYVKDFVTKVRVKNETESTTQKMNVLSNMPRFILKTVFWFLRVLEYWGFYPESLKNDDPRYSTVYISNLGSIKMNADYHHLFGQGTISFFVVIGEKKMRPIFKEDGSYEMRDTINLGMTIDERIADGYYFAKSIRLLKYLLQNPDLLDLDIATPVEFE